MSHQPTSADVAAAISAQDAATPALAGDARLQAIAAHPDFQRLARGRARLSGVLTAVLLAIYFGFLLVLALLPAWLARPWGGGPLSWGIPVAVAVIVVAFLLTAFYVRQANHVLDPINRRLLEEFPEW